MVATTADDIIDRRRLRKKISFWRILSFAILAIALIGMILFGARDLLLSKTGKAHIAKVEITGVITNDGPMLKLLETLKEEKKVKGVILSLSSPGGSTVGGEAMFEGVRSLSEAKPVVTSVGTLAASAGYMIASASDHIVARRSSIVGSIGVLFQYADASELLDKIGVKVKAVKSSPLKAEPSPFNPASDEAVAMIDRLIQDSYHWFVDIVTERRDLTRTQVLNLADGSIFTGNQGLANGLIDAIGGEETALNWLKTEKELSEDLEIVAYKPVRPGDTLFGTLTGLQRIAEAFGLDLTPTQALHLKDAIQERLPLEGLVSQWQGGR